MAPQELNCVPGNKRINNSNDKSQIDDCSVPTKRKKRKKKKANNGNLQTRICQPEKFISTVEIITLDSDDCDDKYAKSDDDVIIIEPTVEHVELSGDESATLSVKNDIETNIVINISQPLDVDRLLEPETHLSLSNDLSTPLISEPDGPPPPVKYPRAWTKDMIDYYTRPSEKYKNFDYENILKTMKSKPEDWYINVADKYGISSRRRNYVRCRKCHQTGHIERECKKNVVCYICGQFNHVYLTCPNTLCLTCGKRTAQKTVTSCNLCCKFIWSKKTCALCGQMYHSEQLCPSKWRQYLILDDSTLPAKPNPRVFCYNCAQSGHFGFECPLEPYSNYPQENPVITTLLNRTLLLEGKEDNNNNNSHNNAVISLSQETTDLLKTEEGDQFLKSFSADQSMRVEFCQGVHNYVKIIGEKRKVTSFRMQLNQWKKNMNGGAPALS